MGHYLEHIAHHVLLLAGRLYSTVEDSRPFLDYLIGTGKKFKSYILYEAKRIPRAVCKIWKYD